MGFFELAPPMPENPVACDCARAGEAEKPGTAAISAAAPNATTRAHLASLPCGSRIPVPLALLLAIKTQSPAAAISGPRFGMPGSLACGLALHMRANMSFKNRPLFTPV